MPSARRGSDAPPHVAAAGDRYSGVSLHDDGPAAPETGMPEPDPIGDANRRRRRRARRLVTTLVSVAVVAGALASVLPGHRAARARPVEALAEA